MAYVHEDPWDAVLSFGQLSLSSLITLSCVNQSLRRLCSQNVVAGTAAQDLLLQAVSAAVLPAEPDAASATSEDAPEHSAHLIKRFEQQIAWLVKRVPTLLQGSGAMSAIMLVHNVPKPVAAALLRNGARFSWQQLSAAADSLVPGLQVWAHLSRTRELQLDNFVPRIAVAICCGDELDLQSPLQWDLPADAPPGTLINRRSELLPGLAQLALALPRSGHATSALEGLCGLQEAAELDSSTVAGLLKAALQMGASERVMVLMRLPAVRQLEQGAVLQLLQLAVDRRLPVSVRLLCELPVLQAAQDSGQCNTVWSDLWSTVVNLEGPATLRALCQLPAACAAVRDVHALLPLLHAAVRSNSTDARKLGFLCRLRAAADVSSDDAAELLLLAVEGGSTAKVAELVQLQGLQAVTFDNVLSLLQASMQCSNPRLPAALVAGMPADLLQQLQPHDVVNLVQTALAAEQQQGTGQRLQALWALPAAQAVSVDSACSLLQHAVQHPDAAAVEVLCRLAGAQQIDESSISSLLAGALASGGYRKVDALVQLPAAQVLTADALLPIVHAAAHSTEWQPLVALLKLSAAAELSVEAVCALLHVVFSLPQAALAAEQQQGTWQRLLALCPLPAAQAVSVDSACSLLQSAVQHPDAAAVEVLCSLAAAQQINESSVSSLLEEAFESGGDPGYKKVDALVQLPAAQALSGEAVGALLSAAADAVRSRGTSHAMQISALCNTPGAANASTEVLVAALLAVLDEISATPDSCWDNHGGISSLCDLLAEQQRDVPAGDLARILQAAHSCVCCSSQVWCDVWQLLNLPAATQLQEQLVSDCVQQVLQDASWWSCHWAVRGLQLLSTATIEQLLTASLQASNAAAAPSQLDSPPANSAAEESCSAQADVRCAASLPLLTVLCQLPAAQQLSAVAIQQLLPGLTAIMCQQTCLLTQTVQPHRSDDGSAGRIAHNEHAELLLLPASANDRLISACMKMLQQLLMLPGAQQMGRSAGSQFDKLQIAVWETEEKLRTQIGRLQDLMTHPHVEGATYVERRKQTIQQKEELRQAAARPEKLCEVLSQLQKLEQTMLEGS